MPTICKFYGIIIRMFYDDHSPPHFHAEYGEYRVVIDIESMKVMSGIMTGRALALVFEWASMYRYELLEDWDLCRQHKQPKKIKPLE